MADPWITLAAVAVATERVTIGPMVTPLARRRPHQLARETVTLDRLSGGRLVLGAGLGSPNTPEFRPERFGEEGDPKARAVLLDDGLEKLAAYWDGDFEPRPVQQPRIPVWIASRWPSRRPLKRAARWDGMFPIEMPGPARLAELVAEAQGLRNVFAPFDVVVDQPGGHGVGALDRGRRHLVPGRLRAPALAGRGRGGHRRRPRVAVQPLGRGEPARWARPRASGGAPAAACPTGPARRSP